MSSFCKEKGLLLHCDGARLFNAALKTGTPVSRLVRDCDSVSICLSKGLGAPIGSLIVGSQKLIERAFRTRKALGGSMRTAGVIAAAGLYALENNIERMKMDHENVLKLGRGRKKENFEGPFITG